MVESTLALAIVNAQVAPLRDEVAALKDTVAPLRAEVAALKAAEAKNMEVQKHMAWRCRLTR